MKQHLESKTIFGLVIMLLLSLVLSLTHNLTPEMVDVIKWVGSSFMAVRLGANVSENMGRKRHYDDE